VSTHYERGSGRELFGLIIIFIGFGLLMNTMNVFPFTFVSTIMRFWWPAMFLGLGVLMLSKGRSGAGATFFLLVGSLLLLNQLHFWNIQFSRMIWPALLIWFGVSMLMKRSRPDSFRRRDRSERFENGAHMGFEQSRDSSDYLHATAILGGFNRKSDSTQFRGGDLTAIMGGGKIDLRDAQMQNGEAMIDVFTVMGGIEIQVPTDWIVEPRLTPILGGFEDKTRRPIGTGKTLAIQGTAIMGGVTVSN
jgi:predicted membrane protein